MRWGMVIDLKKCIGCYSCTIACKQEHFLPPGVFWNNVLMTHKGTYPAVIKEILPVICNHCKEAACVEVCPTGASQKRDDGIVVVEADKCVGCRACVVACPYQQRTYFKKYTPYYQNEDYTPPEHIGKRLYPHEEGTVIKCTFCFERLEYGISHGLQPGKDPEATPACVNACPTTARVFGDLDDPASEPSRLTREKKALPLAPEFGTEPSVLYLRY